MLCVVCYVLYLVRNVCISLVLKTFLESCLGLEKSLEMGIVDFTQVL